MALTSSSGDGAPKGIRGAERRLVVAEAETRRKRFEWDRARSHLKARVRERVRRPGTIFAAFFSGLLFGALRAPDLKRVSGLMSIAVLLFRSRDVVRNIVTAVRGSSKRARTRRRLPATGRPLSVDQPTPVVTQVVVTQEVIRGQ